MVTEKQKQLIKKQKFAAVGTTNEDGSPNVIAVEVNKVTNDTIVITDNFMKRTRDNIARDGRICLTVWDEKEGYKIIGKAKYENKGTWFDFVKKENTDYPAKGAIVITVEKIISLG